ncbi:MAG: Zn-ribbon domain-containing OB-fold protein [Betaproteobacteria bacterium]|nr:Zn-ribbon domain-containing OB-fold protein [Betaproteobacteria bacterium]
MFPRPLPSPNALTAPYWEAALNGELELPRCETCAAFHFYPRTTCPHCGSQNLAWHAVSGRGEVYSFTVVHRAPSKGFEALVPYVVAVVALEEGPHLMTRLIGVAPEAVRIGLKVKVEFKKQDEQTRLPVFRALA